MAKLSRDLANPVGGQSTLHPRETLFATGLLGALNAEVVVNCDGCNAVSLDMRGTFSLTAEVSGTVDGANWVIIPMRPISGGANLAAIVGTVSGVWLGACVGYRAVRVRASAYTSGGAVVTLCASTAQADPFVYANNITSTLTTATGAAGAGVTLTIASPGAGLRHYLTYLRIARFATAVLTPAAAPVVVTTTNLPGSLAFSMPADAAAQGTVFDYQEAFTFPLAATAQATATTIVCPATTNVIWRVTAGHYVAP